MTNKPLTKSEKESIVNRKKNLELFIGKLPQTLTPKEGKAMLEEESYDSSYNRIPSPAIDLNKVNEIINRIQPDTPVEIKKVKKPRKGEHCDLCGYIGEKCICDDENALKQEAIKLLASLIEKTEGVVSEGVIVSKSLSVVLSLLKGREEEMRTKRVDDINELKPGDPVVVRTINTLDFKRARVIDVIEYEGERIVRFQFKGFVHSLTEQHIVDGEGGAEIRKPLEEKK